MEQDLERLLAEGQLPLTESILYQCPGYEKKIESSVKSVTIIKMSLVNTNNATVTINIRYKNNALRNISPYMMPLNAGDRYVDNEIYYLEPGDSIEGQASVANTVDYLIFGKYNV